VVKMLRSKLPTDRFGQPEEVAALMAFPAGEVSGLITSAVIDINAAR
jgi:NAD(P)-dependent dehydrogenase (short-subunit alcohol dehydrogenase family)